MDSLDEKNPAAKSQFEKVRQGKQTLVISKWVFVEIIKIIIDAAMRDPLVRQTRTPESVRNHVTAIFREYGRLVIGMRHVVFSDPATRTSLVFKRAYDLSQRVFGNVSKEPKCPVCHGPYDFFKYRGPYQVDYIHALVARDLQCQKILTFDHDFSLLKDEVEIQPLSVEVLTKHST